MIQEGQLKEAWQYREGDEWKNMHSEVWAIHAFDKWRELKGYSTDQSIANLSEEKDISNLIELLF